MKEKIAFWITQKHGIPYRFRKSFVKRVCPKILSDYSFEINYNGIKYAGNTKNEKDRVFLMFGGNAKYVTAFFRDYCQRSKKKITFLDVGAGAGNDSLFLSKYVKKLFSFEPNEKLAAALAKKLKRNRIKNIELFNIGLSNKNDNASFDGISEFELRVGDEFLKEKGVKKVDIINIAPTDFSREIIEGLSGFVHKNKPLIVLDFSRLSFGCFGSVDDFESVFPKGYKFYKFAGIRRDSSKYKLAKFNYDADIGFSHVVASVDEL